jgi:hypothetical protein
MGMVFKDEIILSIVVLLIGKVVGKGDWEEKSVLA